MSDRPYVRPKARIGNGGPQTIAGIIGMVLGIFVTTGVPTYPLLGAVAGVILAISVGLIVAGFWSHLFHLLEERLIDVDAAIRGAPQEKATPRRVDEF